MPLAVNCMVLPEFFSKVEYHIATFLCSWLEDASLVSNFTVSLWVHM